MQRINDLQAAVVTSGATGGWLLEVLNGALATTALVLGIILTCVRLYVWAEKRGCIRRKSPPSNRRANRSVDPDTLFY